MNKIKMIYMGGGIGMISMWSLWELDFELPGNHKRVCYNIGKLRALCYAINTPPPTDYCYFLDFAGKMC